MANFFNNFFGIGNESETENYEPQPVAPTAPVASTTSSKVVSIDRSHVSVKSAPAENGKIMLFEPRLYGESKEIVDELLNHHAVIVNFSQMDNKAANKVVDFLNGAVYAIDGEIKRIGEQIFLCVPRGVDVAGKLAGDLNSNSSERL
ncbi:cell division protein SepF [Limosilactobacillus mucosae]|uniref:cell division protein SepF n=1 Tax=Limosilactobacillus mucosae TaxID=97478 RepID=UPI0025A3B135|nr:cell division protein SepF [Limosilactobacillus mucosae]MDM8220458.1 cell division protein SepF [Limosilactobacillus mucosae]MDM8315034.1 cell division protein SepF [Limosilactobacillus mucosae]